ncbi:glycosyltransferase family 2 protein [Methylobacterium nonmethylotrophicum]|uniref:Glycosyltransferase n=1 Tax=Methylobacterium nonmethylotrophicum TaxID=1141884 RepID=A0A4Z0NGP5_9HYPH|nr:cellulose synthase catalytic subunit [Methylobacterium nonmethylotrophicum]TGD94927.1 glycosyltransferase [Methylobacterium nonmethylotrophicum]
MFEAPQDVSAVLTTDLGILIGLLVMAGLLDRASAAARALFGATLSVFILCYAAWRWHDTLPRFELSPERIWPYIFFLFETIAIAYTLMSTIILLRFKNRSHEADREEARLGASGEWPAVDIFICTYNEPQDVVEKSIVPALAVDYPNATVWVCDDTRRDWLRAYCDEVGARYITRPDNKGAKAGNLNNALALTARHTNAPIILVLDADFAVAPNILRRTVGLFHDERAAVVQTPQFFFNADPIQHNLMAAEAWVDDQRIFFDVFQPAKDAWGCAFCVGTSFLVRRDRVTEMGGFPHDAICEDINLTYSLMRHGYQTHWLNERLSAGLSAEGLPEYITQRTRWCLGTMQVALLKDGPFRSPHYTLMQRLHYLHGVMNWLCKPFIVLMLVAPSIYWFFGMPAFYADYLSFLRYGVPALLALWIYSGWVSGQRTLPLFMEVTHIMTALPITFTLASAAVRPFGRPFKVTDKGGDRSISTVRWRMAAGFGGIALMSASAILWSFISPSAATEISPLDYFNLVWAGIAMLLTFVAFLVCFERPRGAEEFRIEEPVRVRAAGLTYDAVLARLGLETALLRIDAGRPGSTGDPVDVRIEGVGWVPARLTDVSLDVQALALAPDPRQRHALILRLFTQAVDPIARTANLAVALRSLAARCFRAA